MKVFAYQLSAGVDGFGPPTFVLLGKCSKPSELNALMPY